MHLCNTVCPLKIPTVQCYKDQSKVHFIMTHNISLHTDILSMNVSWLLEDLELFENQFNILESMICTIAIFITFVMAIIVHRAFYKLMKRLPGRDINQIIFPYMVKWKTPKTMLVQCRKQIFLTNYFSRFFSLYVWVLTPSIQY